MKHVNLLFLSMLLLLGLSGSLSLNAQTIPSFDKEQYQKALWMTTRFYGAQRSGDGPNWLIADYEPTDVANDLKSNLSAFVKGKSYIKDADGDYDLTGGWYDCGDFATFGQTFFYSAYMLLLGYSEFPAGFDDYYSTDYHGYITAGDYTWEGKKGVPDGIPDVLNEAKYATDFILKAVRSSSVFYYQKGNGDDDHKVWCTSPTKSTLTKSQGGESNGSREMGKATGNVTSMASLAGASLAVMARVYQKFDPEYAQKCLEKALVAYEFVNGTAKSNSVGATSFYGNKPKFLPDEVIFFAELYRTTGDSKYLKAAENVSEWMTTSSGYDYNFSLCYNNTEDLACYLMASFGNATTYSEYAMTAMDYYINTMYKPSSGYFLNKKNDSWGVLRFPANQAFTYALYDKLKGVTTLNPYSLTSIEYIMGKNGAGFSYIVGFGNKHPLYPHHRNFYRSDNNNEGSLPIITNSYKYIQLGYLVGGSLNNGAYTDEEKMYTFSEGGIDYNAGLVCALGYINSLVDPVDINKFGHPTPELGDEVSICGAGSILLDSKVASDGKKIFTWSLDGVQLTSSTSADTYSATKGGEYTCVIDSAGEWQTSGSVKVWSELIIPTFDFSAVTLCNPASHTFDLSEIESVNPGVNYAWYKNNELIEGATDPTYTVYHAGTYSCEISINGCDSKKVGDFTVNTKLPVVADARSYSDGQVTLTVDGDGEYEWYASAEGGTPLATGTSFTTTISKNTMFYVQDAGSANFVAGPTTSSFSEAGVNWGRIGATFTARKMFLINGFTVKPFAIYNSDPVSISVELSKNGTVIGTYTSNAVENKGTSNYYTLTFSDPIEIPEAGSYTLKPSAGVDLEFYTSGPAYSIYTTTSSDVLEFTGATNGTASNNPFPAIFNWQIQAGSGCARAMATAIYDPTNTGVGESIVLNEICNVYPNPFETLLYLDLSCNLLDKAQNVNVEVLSSIGTVVKRVNTTVNDLADGLNLSELQQGVYLIRVVSGDFVAIKQVIKK